jgi:hypothetical protein
MSKVFYMGAAILLAAGLSLAQVDRGAITGTVLDPSGKAVPDAAIVATHEATGVERRTHSNGQGAYQLAELPIGNWTVVITAKGFRETRYEGVAESVGQSRMLNPVLTVSGGDATITVAEQVVNLDQSTASLGDAVEKKAIDDLPLNGRNWTSLTQLAPGAIDQGGSTQRSIRFTGRGRDEMNITYDGVDATGIVNQSQKAYVRLAIPVSAIAEFRVTSVLPTAESGDASGAQISVVSPSGSNLFHGSLFEYFRNSNLDARSPFDLTATPLPFRLNQFGGTFGGAIQKNRTFFFLDHEELRQVQDLTLIGFVPSAQLRSQIAAQSPVLAPIVNAYPVGNGSTSATGVQQSTRVGGSADSEYSETLRIDHRLSDSTAAYLRFTYDDATLTAPLGTLADRQQSNSKPLNGVFEVLHTFSPTVVDEFKFGTNQMTSHQYNLTTIPYAVNVSGFTGLNGSQTSNQDGRTFGWVDHLSVVRGRHTLKTGGEVRRIGINEGNSFSGTLTYSALANFTNNNLDSATYLALLPLKRMRKTAEFLYFQDEIKLRPNLTLNAGIRWEHYSVFHETKDRAIPFDFESCGGFCAQGAPFLFPSRKNFDPRAGLAWSPRKSNGGTVIRVGYGIYHEDAQLDDQNFPTANDVPRYSLSRGAQFPNLAYPFESLLPNATGVLSPKDQIRQRKDTYSQQWSVSLQQSLPGRLLGSVSYIGNKATNVMNRSQINVIDPLTKARPYPQFGQIELRAKDANGEFQALQAGLKRSFSHGLLVSANYMWSHAINEGALGSGVEDVFPENVGCRACERASSDQDARQSLAISTVYELRYRGPLKALFGGWEAMGVGGGRTGLPVNVTVDRSAASVPDGNTGAQRPNATGASIYPASQTPGQWLNIAAFAVPAAGTWGNLGRNAARGPGLWQVDAALQRKISLRERASLQIRGEVFNLLNRAQYGNPGANIAAPASFGRITTLVNTSPTGSGTPRQIELAMRLVF